MTNGNEKGTNRKPRGGPIKREGPLPDGHPFKGGHVFFTSGMSPEHKQRLREHFGKGRREAAVDDARERNGREDSE